jgi:hypothetical protein
VCVIGVWSHKNSALFEVTSHDSALSLAYFQTSTHSLCKDAGTRVCSVCSPKFYWLGDSAASPVWTWITTTSCKLSVTGIDVINWVTIYPQQNWCAGHQRGCETRIPQCKFPLYAKIHTPYGGYYVNFEYFTVVSKLRSSEIWPHL